MSKNLQIGSLVAPVWTPTGGGSAMGSKDESAKDLSPRCARLVRIAKKFRELGVRPHGVVQDRLLCGSGQLGY